MSRFTKNLIITAFLIIASFVVVNFALAQSVDTGMSFGQQIGLSNTDPRIMAANVIRIVLGFLGIIAVGLIIYAGWLYMTAGGEADKIEQAKKMLINAAIGLVIILSAFGIVTFIISSMLGATGGTSVPSTGICNNDGICDSGETCSFCPGDCGSCDIFSGGSSDNFYISSASPTGDNVIMNAKIRFQFNKEIALTTVDTSTFSVKDQTTMQIPGNIRVSGRTIEFVPDGTCPNNTCGATNCFEENKVVTVEVTGGASGILSVNDKPVSCSMGVCSIEFTVGNVIDCEDPTVSLYFNGGQLCVGADNVISATANDVSSGISHVEFFAKPGVSPEVGIGDLSYPGPYSVNWDGNGYAVGDSVIFKATAYDEDDHSKSDTKIVNLRPAHCCNGVVDGTEGETGIDCGGPDCAHCEGAACATDINSPSSSCSNDLCASGFCTNTLTSASVCASAGYTSGIASCCLCQNAPRIDWVSLNDGAPGNFITIGGKYFGDNSGEVYFSDATGLFNIPANFPNSVNTNCSDTWKDDKIIVVVPELAVSGPIKVVEADHGYEDDTSNSNTRGATINFDVNDTVRPGICMVTPEQGIMGDNITYQGINLSGGKAYFGNETNKSIASDSNFSETSGTAKVSNIGAGRTSTFVSSAGVNSNYLEFKKNAESYAGPKIISFEPTSGAPGQYVTIHGSGFGAVKGSSEVYFSESPKILANYDFPLICADSVWSDNQVIVKVPADSMTSFITMEIVSGGKTYNVSSSGLFTINSNPLTPSLCKIDPAMGPNNVPISLWGENFGEQTNVSVKFYSNKNQSDIDSWGTEGGAQKIVTSVQSEAQTGPVQVAQGSLISNGLNFNVGSCVQNVDCASGVCCPFDSNEAGQCKADLNSCYSNATGSVYEWEFSTGNSESGGGCNDEQISCGASCCAAGKSCLDASNNCCEGSTCSSGEITCGDETCIAEECVDGECPPSQCNSNQTVCGSGCCENGVACAEGNRCENSTCSELEIQCGTECCATGCDGGVCPQADRPGETCFADSAPSTCSVYPAACGANYGCMAFGVDTCGTCCCDASTPGVNSNGLICVPDKSPCVGGNRGLYCGCEKDLDCGSTSNTVGCGSDTCCRTRPSVSDVYPIDNATAICRNTIINADFNQPMNVSSFSGNIIVVGDYGNSDCPASAPPLSLETNIQNKNIFAKAYEKIAGSFRIISGIFKGDSALAGLPDPANNYCAVTGTIKGVYNADKTTSITFNPNKPLDAGRTYYVVIKGDEDLDSSKGVLNSWGIGMNGPDSATMNGKPYAKAKIWSFRTGNDVCKLDSVRIDPASYLFQTSINDTGDDNAAALDSFDKIDDSDKLFTANAMSNGGQIIAGMSGSYNWSWEWSSTNPTVAEVSDSGMVTAQNVKDGETLIEAKATITEDTISTTSTVGQNKIGQSEVYVFLCANPWPPVVSGTWTPWKDSTLGMNCLPDTGDCRNTNFEFYYCRDQGASGPADDLPAILSGDTIIRGESSIQDILKEAYFFRE
jgi:hypothetical protein